MIDFMENKYNSVFFDRTAKTCVNDKKKFILVINVEATQFDV